MNYKHIKRGFRDDIGISVRSGWEANIFRYFKWLKEIKEISDFEYESMTFWFKNVSEIQHLDLSKNIGLIKGNGILRGGVSYLPDFKVYDQTGIYYVEVKGYMKKEAATKIKRFRKYYPNEELRVFDKKIYKEIENKVGKIILNWEF